MGHYDMSPRKYWVVPPGDNLEDVMESETPVETIYGYDGALDEWLGMAEDNGWFSDGGYPSGEIYTVVSDETKNERRYAVHADWSVNFYTYLRGPESD